MMEACFNTVTPSVTLQQHRALTERAFCPHSGHAENRVCGHNKCVTRGSIPHSNVRSISFSQILFRLSVNNNPHPHARPARWLLLDVTFFSGKKTASRSLKSAQEVTCEGMRKA
ncbi:uncharacterized [Tachysurus ichikawai]